MPKRKLMVTAFLVFCITVTLLVSVITSGAPSEYDPWVDLDDNGEIDIFDALILAGVFGSEGTPINKTASLLELQQGIDLLNMSISELGLRMDDAEADTADLNATLEARIPQKGYISVSAATFVASDNTANWRCSGGDLYHLETGGIHFYGAVQLPDGATVTNVTFHWSDWGGLNVQCQLKRHNLTMTLNVASMVSSGDTGTGSSYDDTIDFATIDNSQNTYYFDVLVPSGSYYFRYAIIEYEYLA